MSRERRGAGTQRPDMTNRDHHLLWEVSNGDSSTRCVMVSCCGGAELQIVRAIRGDEQIVLRELYPDRSSLYDRARELQLEHADA
jgi:hypothetical protein